MGGVMIMAGGTGGHIFPGLAVAAALRDQQVPVHWLGGPRGLENQLVPAAGIELQRVAISGLRGRGALGWLAAPFRILRAVIQARRILRRCQPGCVLSMGGYAAGPGGLAARWLGIPLVVHEQNRHPGLTNRWLARWASRVCVGFDGTFPASQHSEVTGNPVRQSIAALAAPEQRFAERQGPLRLLVLGGSLGARFLNRQVPAMLAMIEPDQRPVVRHQCGARGEQETRDAYQQSGLTATVEPFIDDMAAAYEWADVVICRAGALTVSELMAAGLGAVLVPYPHAVDDHQAANGSVLSEAGAALLMRENDWDSAALAKQVGNWTRPRLQTMATAARALHPGDAAGRVAAICQEVQR
ncbi:MAG: undecaprenyldiphospho-muramoylpentapeptide beta-N-acetylglucosaminyltransferase [Wenzhouxiangellaceae bacterium]